MAQTLLEYAITLLARRDYPHAEMQDKLTSYQQRQKRGRRHASDTKINAFDVADETSTVGDRTVEEVIEQLLSLGYLDDDKFVHGYIRSKAMAGQGPIKIKHLLKQKKVDASTIETGFQRSKIDWFSVAREVFEKKYPMYQRSESEDGGKDWKLLQKQAQFMQQRGFEYQHIQAVTEEN